MARVRIGEAKVSWKYPIYNGGVRLWELKEAMRHADFCILLNEHDKKYSIAKLGIDADRIRMVDNGIPPALLGLPFTTSHKGPIRIAQIGSNIPSANVTQEQQKAYRISLGVSVDELLVGYFGFISPRKEFDALLDAIAQLRKARTVCLIAIGSREAEIPIKYRCPSVIATGYLGYDEVAIAHSFTDVNAFPFVDGSAWRYTSLLDSKNSDRNDAWSGAIDSGSYRGEFTDAKQSCVGNRNRR